MAISGEKKRKRAEEASSASRKKANVQAPSQSQIIKVASVKSTRTCPPVIATSPGLVLPESIKFQAYSNPEASVPKRSKKSAAVPPYSLVLHSSAHRTLDYTAKEDGLSGREAHLKHYIGVFDPKTGQLSVMEAKKMAVRGLVRAQRPPEESVAEWPVSKTMLELRNDLGEAFGTKKARKAIAAITENAIAPEAAITDAGGNPRKLDASAQAMMESIQETTQGMATIEELQASVDQAKPVPPGNFDATEIHDVYKPEQLIGTDILNSIPVKQWQDAVKKNVGLSLPHQFISANMHPIASGPDAVKRLRILRYMNYLIIFHKNTRSGKERGVLRIPQRDKLIALMENAPTPVVEDIRRKFSVNGEIRKFQKDLLMTYCCAIAAILSNFEFDTSTLRYDLGLDEKQFAQYFREIGGKISNPVGKVKGTKMQLARLALPLEFPKVRFVSRRR
ncbi:RNA polymerase I associated factor, A49-like protein [Xylariales sp. AK1849]|nr:RNA polymerase I associated factor, A49-like protein [Xylariales sp. AK1849]